MSTDVNVPTMGESITEATVGQWLKAPGDAVALDEPIVSLETDKVAVEVNAPVAGTLAEQLVKDMSAKWNPDDYKDEFKDAIMKLVHQRVKAGKTETVAPLEHVEESASGGAQIIDLTELLKRSLQGKSAPAPAKKAAKSAAAPGPRSAASKKVSPLKSKPRRAA